MWQPGDERSSRHCLFLPSGLPLRWQRAQERLGSFAGDLKIFLSFTDMLIAFLNCFVQSALQEALRANVALEDINRTALVRLKQVSISSLDVILIMHAPHYFHTHSASRALRSLASGSPIRSHPRMPRKTLRTAASVLLTGLRCEHQCHLLSPSNIFAKFSKNFVHRPSQTYNNHTYRKG